MAKNNGTVDLPLVGKISDKDLPSYVCYAQASYYLLTGIWPILSIGTFQKVTGPKTDLWLVKTVALLIAAIGAAIGMAGYRRQVSPEIPVLAVSSAAGLTAIDVIYVAKKRIRPIYLLDGLGEVGLIALWALAWPRTRSGKRGAGATPLAGCQGCPEPEIGGRGLGACQFPGENEYALPTRPGRCARLRY